MMLFTDWTQSGGSQRLLVSFNGSDADLRGFLFKQENITVFYHFCDMQNLLLEMHIYFNMLLVSLSPKTGQNFHFWGLKMWLIKVSQ